jgi:homogentisate 1,2-dioxygenase
VSHRYHLPPSVHTTFLSDRFVVCTFTPRPFEPDPGALKVPFFHNNDDYDEVLFYHAGDFFSRDNIKEGPAAGVFRSDIRPGIAKRAFFGALDEMSRYWVLSSTKKYSIIEAAREISKFFLDGITVCADKAADAPPTA